MILVKLRSRRQAKVHEVGDGGLAFPAVDRLHGCRFRDGIVVNQTSPSLGLVLLPKWLVTSGLRSGSR